MTLPSTRPLPAQPSPTAGSPTANPTADVAWLLDSLLSEQKRMSAVERFARLHDRGEVLAPAGHYRALLPAEPPGPGQQYAFDVDLDSCSGCKACVSACHTLNGLDEHETWRDVGLLVGGSSEAPLVQHVTTACHHCLQPACLVACPVNAYEKDPLTGIVRHLDDQCFGCQYCVLACPYDVPKYHAAKGIVRKCDMCSSRLATGEAPACVQACPQQAIAIRVVDARQIVEDAETVSFPPTAPDPQITLPTTTYRTSRVFPPNALPPDYFRVAPQHAHWPLAIMLVMTQLSVGAFAAWLLLDRMLPDAVAASLRPIHATGALLFGLLALFASVFHLGRPWLAFRAVLGLKHSWLSREIVAFGLFASLAAAYAVAAWFSADAGPAARQWLDALGWGVVLSGAAGVGCSVMIYAFTRREYWSVARTTVRFTLSAAVLGVATVWLSAWLLSLGDAAPMADSVVAVLGPRLCLALAGLTAIKLLWEAALFRHLAQRRATAMKRSAMLMIGELSSVALARFALGALGGVVMPAMLAAQLLAGGGTENPVQRTTVVALLLSATLAGELLERYLFFAAVAAPRMPGALR